MFFLFSHALWTSNTSWWGCPCIPCDSLADTTWCPIYFIARFLHDLPRDSVIFQRMRGSVAVTTPQAKLCVFKTEQLEGILSSARTTQRVQRKIIADLYKSHCKRKGAHSQVEGMPRARHLGRGYKISMLSLGAPPSNHLCVYNTQKTSEPRIVTMTS